MKKKAVIIGASTGLGHHLASRLAEEGWAVLGTGRRQLDPAIDGFEYVQTDLSKPASHDALDRLLRDRAPDLVVHNAASYGDARQSAPDIGALETMFLVNAIAPYRILRTWLLDGEAGAHRTCVVINSDSIYHANRQTGPYAASKAALRVFTSALANECKTKSASVSTLLLGPLADQKKRDEFRNIAARRGIREEDVVHHFLERSNPSFVIRDLIGFEPCFQSVKYIVSLGLVANGMLCKLDGGSSGSLV